MNRKRRAEIPGLIAGETLNGLPAWLLAAAMLAGAPVQAREDDRQQPATIEADRAEIDRASGESLYLGNVLFEQGTLHLTGDRVAIARREGVVDQAKAQGEPARIRQENDQGQIVRAHGRTIDYNAGEGLIVLTGNAELEREGERFTAGRIRYWPDSGRVEGGRGDDGGGRVQIRIEPTEGNGNGDGDDAP